MTAAPSSRRARAGVTAPGRTSVASAPPPDPRHPAHLAAALVAAACVLISVSFTLYDADAWQNLIYGRAIWTLGAIPATQIFAWPNFGAPLVNPSWGFTALVWPFWSAGGVTGLFVWRWLTTLAVFVLLWLAARRLGARGFAPLVVLAVCALVYRQRSQIRPETLASVWFALTVLVLEARRAAFARGAGARRIDPAWWLVPIVLAWVNSHISFSLAFVLLGIHLAGGRLAGRADRTLMRVGLAALAVSFVNPWGWRTLARPFEYAFVWRDEPMFRAISEIKPPDWSINWANGLPLLMAGWPLLILWRYGRRRGDPVEALTCAAFTVVGLTSSRFIATYALAAAPYVARDLDEWLAARVWPRAFQGMWPRAALASVLCVGTGLYEWRHSQGPIAIAFDHRHSPRQACRFMAERGVRGRGFNHFYVGSTMLWRFWPERERLPFMTGSPEDFPAEQRSLYFQAQGSAEGWRALDARYRFDYALLSRRYTHSYGLLDLLDADPAWARVFVDDLAAVYVRRAGPLAPLAATSGYRLVTGGRTTVPALLERAAADPALRAALIAELERQGRESPDNFLGRQMLRALGVR